MRMEREKTNLQKITDFADKSLLIVDDDNLFRDRLARAMEKKGFQVDQAESVKKGISQARNAPPAFAATTILTKAIEIKRTLPLPTAITTAPIMSAVVKLSAIGDIKNAIKPVSQNNCLKLKPLLISQTFSFSNTKRSRIASM